MPGAIGCAAMLGGKQAKQFFFVKKNQKTFICSPPGGGLPRWRG
jgi:hypothetical protein